MVLKIVVLKTDYTPFQREKIADVMIRNCDQFIDQSADNVAGAFFEAQFVGGGLTRLSRVIRAIRAIERGPMYPVCKCGHGHLMHESYSCDLCDCEKSADQVKQGN